MALNVDQLATALAQADITVINSVFAKSAAAGAVPPTLTDSELENINQRAQLYAQAIYTWILTATVNTTVNTNLSTLHPSGTINVTGTALAQTNPAPVVGGGTGSGTGVGSIS